MPMKELKVVVSNNMKYSIIINHDFSLLKEKLKSIFDGNSIVIITDDNVEELYLSQLIHSIEDKSYSIHKMIIKHGECTKNYKTLLKIYDFLMSVKFGRTDLIIALGGGVVGDVAGFAAATYLRGVSFVQIPTTLLAQVDSSIGGKVAINYNNIKNNIGAFHQPSLVYINTTVLKTLPVREFRNGLAEIIVHGIIQDADLISFTVEYFNGFPDINYDLVEELIYKNCEIKSNIIMQDEKDKGIRRSLNFGHTIGHAIEASYGYKYAHGECVAIGIVSAFKISVLCELINKEKLRYIEKVLTTLNLPIKTDDLNWTSILEKVVYDKKNLSGESIFILPTGIGSVVEYRISKDILMNYIKQINII